MLYYLKFLENVWGPLRLFEYLTVRAAVSAAIALLVGMIFAPKIIACVRHKIQPQRGAELLKGAANKEKVPTMGGLIILLSTLTGTLLCAQPNAYVLSVLLVFVGMSCVGFLDDWLKVARKNTDGISEKAKWIGLTLSAVAGFAVLFSDKDAARSVTELWIPFVKNPLFANAADGLSPLISTETFPLFLVVAGAFAIYWFFSVGASNAVNLTDGLDGLAAGCVIPNALVFSVVAYLAGNTIWSHYLNIAYIPGAGELAIFCIALAAGTLVFLWFNAEPAEVYMGDVGALGIGGGLGAVAVLTGQPIILAFSGFIFVIEAVSVMIQRTYFKATKKIYGEGRRIFLSTPIHHSFQQKGMRNSKIVIRMWIVSLALALFALMTLKLR